MDPLWAAGLDCRSSRLLYEPLGWHTTRAYEIVSLLGAGGMGEVYRARDLNLHRDVAIKVIDSTSAAITVVLNRTAGLRK